MAKNKMERCFNAILDPHPTTREVDSLWEYFEHQCAYCGADLMRKDRNGHLDHLKPVSDGGTNSIYNHALSCATCNGDEKREEEWGAFLERKAEDLLALPQRRQKVLDWMARQPQRSPANEEKQAEAQSIIKGALSNFDDAVARLRKLCRDGT